jgi:hypothetical protein
VSKRRVAAPQDRYQKAGRMCLSVREGDCTSADLIHLHGNSVGLGIFTRLRRSLGSRLVPRHPLQGLCPSGIE